VILFITISVIVVLIGMGTAIFMKSKNSNKEFDINQITKHYDIIKEAYKKFKETETRMLDDIEDLKAYTDKGESITWKSYSISGDEKYLVVKGLSPQECKKIVDAIGGTSFMERNFAFLSFFSAKKISKVQPVAKIKVFPEKDILTTSNIEYSAKTSVVEDDEIKASKWENNLPRFAKPGEYTIKLKVQDKNDNWSDWASKKIVVSKKEGIRRVVAGPNNFFVIMHNGDMLICGENDYGEMGDGRSSKLESLTYNNRIDNIADGDFGTDFSIVRSFNGLVYCSGKNNFGQLGTGNRHGTKIYKKVWGMDGIIQVGAGDGFAGALSAGGEVFMWGNNEDGQLGKAGEVKYSELPEAVQGLGAVKQLSIGSSHVLALLYDGTVMAWGDNRYGQLGLGYTGKSTNVPTQSEIKGVKSVLAGRGYSLAITDKNRVVAWGQNNRNQLGFIGEKEILFPKEVTGLKNIVKFAGGAKFVVALDNMGKIYSWGQYKQTDKTYHEKPHFVDGFPYLLDISANNKYGYGVTSDNKIIRWSSDLKNYETFEIKANYEESVENGEKS
jgi:alpha-tubulin suppressor-like RCC1 family protein